MRSTTRSGRLDNHHGNSADASGYPDCLGADIVRRRQDRSDRTRSHMDQAQRAMQTESNEVLYDVADHIAVITLNAPERMNTISGPMLNDLTRLLIRANEDRDVRCVILTGNGRAFCAGLDLQERSVMGSVRLRQRLRWTCATRRRPFCRRWTSRRFVRVNGAAGYGYGARLRHSHHGGIGEAGGCLRQARWCRNPAAPGFCRE